MNWQVSTNMYRKLQIIVHLLWTLSCDKRGWLVPPPVNIINGVDAPWSPSSPTSPLPCFVIQNHRFSVDSVKSDVHEPLGRYTTIVEKTIHALVASNIRPGVGLFLDTSVYDCIYCDYQTDAMHWGVDAAYHRQTTLVSTPVGTKCITDDCSTLLWWHASVSPCIQFEMTLKLQVSWLKLMSATKWTNDFGLPAICVRPEPSRHCRSGGGRRHLFKRTN